MQCWLIQTTVVIIIIIQGGREVSDFISYLKKNATNKPVVVKGEKEKKKNDKKQEL